MLQYLKSKLRRSAQPTRPSQDVSQLIKDVPRYPPFMKGLPVVGADALLATQAELVGRIKGVLGYPQTKYDLLVAPVLERYAAFVHLLPASEAHHHRGAGGLLRHGLEVSYWAAQASEAQIFPYDGAPRDKAEHEMRWRLAAFLAGLCHDLGKPISDMEISDEHGITTWDPWQQTLLDWAKTSHIDRYFVRWRSGRVHKQHEQFSQLIFKEIAGNTVLSYLSAIDKRTLPALIEAISGFGGRSDVLSRLVMMADKESVSRDMKNNRLEVDENAYGVPIHRYVFDAMRSLVNDRTWTVNEPGAKVWVLQDGTYIVWKAAVKDIIEKIQEMSVPGVPRDADVLADILIDRGYAIQNEVTTGDGEVLTYRYWKIEPQIVSAGQSSFPLKFDLLALRLDSPDRIFTGDIPPALRASHVKQMTASSSQEPVTPNADAVPSDTAQSSSKTEDNPADEASVATQTSDTEAETQPQQDDSDFLPPDLRGVLDKLKKNAPPIPPLEGTENNEADGEVDSEAVRQEAKEKLPEQPSIKPQLTEDHVVGQEAVSDKPQDKSRKDKPKPSTVVLGTALSEPDSGETADEADDPSRKLQAFLEPAAKAGQIIEQLVQPIVHGEQWLGQSLMKVGAELVILYPDGLKALGNPIEIVGELHNAGFIVPDPVMQGRKIRVINDMNVVVLTRELARTITKVLDRARDEHHPSMSEPASVATASVANKVQQSRRKKDLTTQTPIKVEAPATPREDLLKLDEADSIPAAATHPDHGSKAISWQEPEPTKDDSVAYQEGIEQDTAQEARKPRKAPALDMHAEVLPDDVAMVPDDAFEPRTTNAEEACKELVQMMIEGKGRWLVSAVRKEGGMLVTDIGALERMIAEHPSCLSRGSIRQKIRYFGGFIRAKEIYVKEVQNVH